MSMQHFMRKASKKLVEETEGTEKTDGEPGSHHEAPLPKAPKHGKSGGSGAVHNAPAQAKKGTRKKI